MQQMATQLKRVVQERDDMGAQVEQVGEAIIIVIMMATMS